MQPLRERAALFCHPTGPDTPQALTEKSTVLVRSNRNPNLDHSYDFEGPHLTPEGPSPLELAEGLIEALSMLMMNASLLCQVSNCIEAKARAEGITFAEAHDQIRREVRAHPPPDGKWLRWFQEVRTTIRSR